MKLLRVGSNENRQGGTSLVHVDAYTRLLGVLTERYLEQSLPAGAGPSCRTLHHSTDSKRPVSQPAQALQAWTSLSEASTSARNSTKGGDVSGRCDLAGLHVWTRCTWSALK